ncbi:probable cyclic nucleotide-gated ion channel 20, chloroplastic [Daucus carota subsp. sativus]
MEQHSELRHSASSVAVSVDSPPSNDQTLPKDNLANGPFSAIYKMIPGVMNPNSRRVRHWSKFIIYFFFLAFLLQTLLIFLWHLKQDKNCIANSGTLIEVLFDFLLQSSNLIFLLHITFKFRVAYVDPKSTLLVYHPKKVALNYLFGYFIFDLLLVLPFSLRIFEQIFQGYYSSSGPFEIFSFLQCLTLLCRILSLFADETSSAFFFESWSSKFVINLLSFFLFSHVVGSFWYNFALTRVAKCLYEACGEPWCLRYINCENEYGKIITDPSLKKWMNNNNATACFRKGGYDYGIYEQAVSLMTKSNLPMRYIYSLFWGFQQTSTLAGNQIPSFFVVEILFTMFVSAMGLLLFSLLIGNMQSFLQARGHRSSEKFVRGLDVEQWMSQRRLPEELKMKIRQSEQHNWVVTRGVNELDLLENLPDDLQRDIRRHLFKFYKKIPLFSLMDESILDAIRERMEQKNYIKGSRILVHGGLIDKMVFIGQGKLESIGEAEHVIPLSEGDFCGEELVTLCLEHYILNRDREQTNSST